MAHTNPEGSPRRPLPEQVDAFDNVMVGSYVSTVRQGHDVLIDNQTGVYGFSAMADQGDSALFFDHGEGETRTAVYSCKGGSALVLGREGGQPTIIGQSSPEKDIKGNVTILPGDRYFLLSRNIAKRLPTQSMATNLEAYILHPNPGEAARRLCTLHNQSEQNTAVILHIPKATRAEKLAVRTENTRAAIERRMGKVTMAALAAKVAAVKNRFRPAHAEKRPHLTAKRILAVATAALAAYALSTSNDNAPNKVEPRQPIATAAAPQTNPKPLTTTNSLSPAPPQSRTPSTDPPTNRHRFYIEQGSGLIREIQQWSSSLNSNQVIDGHQAYRIYLQTRQKFGDDLITIKNHEGPSLYKTGDDLRISTTGEATFKYKPIEQFVKQQILKAQRN